MSASQDFRDGAATGADTLARRAKSLLAWGVRLDHTTLTKLAEGIAEEYGGHPYQPPMPEDAIAQAWDDGWHEHYLEGTRQAIDPSHPITKTNPHRKADQ